MSGRGPQEKNNQVLNVERTDRKSNFTESFSSFLSHWIQTAVFYYAYAVAYIFPRQQPQLHCLYWADFNYYSCTKAVSDQKEKMDNQA